MDKALNYLALGRKAGRIELGEEPVGAAARAVKAWLVVVASDASDHTWRRAKSFVAGTNQQCIRVPFTIGRMLFFRGFPLRHLRMWPWPSPSSKPSAVTMPKSRMPWKSGPSGSVSARARKRHTSATSAWASPAEASKSKLSLWRCIYEF